MLPNFLTMRNATEQLGRLLHLVQEAPAAQLEQLSTGTVVDISVMPLRAANRKRAPGRRDVSKIDLIVGHVTDVEGGFGVQRWGPDGWQHWSQRLAQGDVPDGILDDIRCELGQLSDDELARALALCSRMRQLAYHRLASPRLGEIKNRELAHRTWVSTLGNGGVGVGIDCHHREELTPGLIEAGKLTVQGLYFDLRAEGAEATIRYAPHGCFSRQRWNDTHREAHLAVFKPAVLELRALGEDVRIDYEVALGGGRPITTRDDPDAHFDSRGRRVKRPNGESL